ncbi:hypothetical protein GCM10017687_55900 [Streptomyces echinatus]
MAAIAVCRTAVLTGAYVAGEEEMPAGRGWRAEKARRKPACRSGLFSTKRRPPKRCLPEARVTGVDPA